MAKTAVILAAGEGTRLEPLTEVRPKPMIPVANRPLLEHVVEAVVGAGVTDLVLVVGYKRERIQNHFGDGDDWGASIEYAVQEKQLGTGHAVLQAEPYVHGEFVALNGDRLIDAAFVRGLVEADRDGDTLVGVTRTDRPSQYGVVELAGDRVRSLTEKPPAHATTSDLINAGVYAFGPDVFDDIRETEAEGELAITATLEKHIAAGRVRAVRHRGVWLDVSNLWDVLAVNTTILDRDGSAVADSARVHESAATAGHVALGADARVGPNATVFGGTTLGDNVEVGPNAVVENSIVFADATVGAGAVVRDCVVGENATLGSNATVAGGRADVVVEGTYHEGVRLGGVVGDNASLGGGVVVEPGTVVGTATDVEAGAVVDGRFESNALIRRG